MSGLEFVKVSADAGAVANTTYVSASSASKETSGQPKVPSHLKLRR